MGKEGFGGPAPRAQELVPRCGQSPQSDRRREAPSTILVRQRITRPQILARTPKTKGNGMRRQRAVEEYVIEYFFARRARHSHHDEEASFSSTFSCKDFMRATIGADKECRATYRQ